MVIQDLDRTQGPRGPRRRLYRCRRPTVRTPRSSRRTLRMDRGTAFEARRNVARRAAFSGSRSHSLPRRPNRNHCLAPAFARTKRTAFSAQMKSSSWPFRRAAGRNGSTWTGSRSSRSRGRAGTGLTRCRIRCSRRSWRCRPARTSRSQRSLTRWIPWSMTTQSSVFPSS